MKIHKKFQIKIPTLSNFIAAPSGGQTKFEKNTLAANSGMSIGTKNMIVFSGNFFKQFPIDSSKLCIIKIAAS